MGRDVARHYDRERALLCAARCRPALVEAVIALSIMPLVHIQTSASKANR
ncbi:MAG: hypothetical protein ACJAYI_001965 [Myxococcota bacterium]|jgi:hypothetical protein